MESKSLSHLDDLLTARLEMFSLRSCSQAALLLLLGAQMSSSRDFELPQPRSSFSTT